MEFADFYNLYFKDQSDSVTIGRSLALVVIQHPERGASWLSNRYKQLNNSSLVNYRSMLLGNAPSMQLPNHMQDVMPEFQQHAQEMNIVPPKMIDWVMRDVTPVERPARRNQFEKKPEVQPTDYAIETNQESTYKAAGMTFFVAGTVFGVVLTMAFYLLNSAGV